MTSRIRPVAERILRSVRESHPPHSELRPVADGEFADQMALYAGLSRQMEAQGLVRLADVEPMWIRTSTTTGCKPALMRFFVSADGAVLADFVQHRARIDRHLPVLLKGLLALRWIASPLAFLNALRPRTLIAVETELTDGGFVITSNLRDQKPYSTPSSLDTTHFPADTPVADLLAAHRTRLAARLEAQPGLAPVPVHTVADMLAMQARLHAQRVAHREAIRWISLAELEMLADNNPAIAAMLHADILQLTGATADTPPGPVEAATPLTTEGAPEPIGTAPDTTPSTALANTRDAFIRQLERAPDPVQPVRTRLTITALTAVAFLVISGLVFSFDFALALLLVIAIHEGGHFLAMLACRYTNLNVFFIPGLGGAATGHKDAGTPWQTLLVYLAGPVPGILLGIGGLSLRAQLPPDSAWLAPLNLYIWISLGVNYLNLLPVVPLDGGRVVEHLLFNRWPWARFGFALLSLLALGSMAWSVSDPVLSGFCVLLALTIPVQMRVARLLVAYRQRYAPTQDRRTLIERLFDLQAEQEKTHTPTTLMHQVNVAKQALSTLQMVPPRRRDSLGGMLLYTVLLLGLPMLGLLALFSGAQATQHREVEASVSASAALAGTAQRQQAATLAAARSDTERWDILMAGLDEDETPDQATLDQAWALARHWPAGDTRRIRTLIAQAQRVSESDAAGATAEAQLLQWRERARAEIARAAGLPGAQRAGLLFSLYQTGYGDSDTVRDLEAAWAALPSDQPTDVGVSIRSALARVRYGQGQPDAAERLLQESYRLATASTNPQGPDVEGTSHWAISETATELALLYLARDQAAPALRIATDASTRLGATAGDWMALQLVRAEAAGALGDEPTALRLLDEAEQRHMPETPWYVRILSWSADRFHGSTRMTPPIAQALRLAVYQRSRDPRTAELAESIRSTDARMLPALQRQFCTATERPQARDWADARTVRLRDSLTRAGLCDPGAARRL